MKHPLFRPILCLFALNLALVLPAMALLSHPAQTPSEPLYLAWVRHLPPLDPTWPDQPRFTSDVAPEPVVADGLVLITSSRHDCLTAFDATTGTEVWRYVADGPIRFAPAVWRKQVYFCSDDGLLSCVSLEDGELRWKLRGGPSDRTVLGNERLISTWPARGAPVVALEGRDEATVYFAAGIWPFMGVFLHAVDARTGKVKWTNSGDSATFIKQPHQTDAFAGIAPQGNLAVIGDRLLVPNGRSITACYDRHTGKQLHYLLADVSKLGGGPDVQVVSDFYINGGGAFALETGKFLGQISEPTAVHGKSLFSTNNTIIRSFDTSRRPDLSNIKSKTKSIGEGWLGEATGSMTVPVPPRAILSAHGRLYAAADRHVFALQLPLVEKSGSAWQAAIEGTPIHLAASEKELFVSTREGRLYAFSQQKSTPKEYRHEVTPLPTASPEETALVKSIFTLKTPRDGYGVLVASTLPRVPQLLQELLTQTKINWIVLEPEESRADELRTLLRKADIDGKRASVIESDSVNLPPYLASVIISAMKLPNLEQTLRPFGGTLALIEGSKVTHIVREGPLPGSADWTHQHANAANTRVSADRLVKAPLGLLWFGGPGNQSILPRHGHGPVPQVCNGRLFIEGPNALRAIDIYTGRLLWETSLPGVGKAYDNTAHQPGANGIGSNYVSLPEGVYVIWQDACVRLDPQSGEIVQRYEIPPDAGEKVLPKWTYLTVVGDYLIAGTRPGAAMNIVEPNKTDPKKPTTKKAAAKQTPGSEASRRLHMLDRHTGKVLWTQKANGGFRHNAVVVGGGRIYAIDRAAGKRKEEPIVATIRAFDLKTGKQEWTGKNEVFGTWLSYSEKHDVLVEAGLMARDTLGDEPPGMRAYQGKSGTVLWYRPEYFGPALIHHERILKGGDARAGSGTACELLTGKPWTMPDPLTGEAIEWRWLRTYGCNTPAAAENLMLFRSGAAGFYDLSNDGGTGNIGGFRSSCTLNLIAAGGVLTAPDFTRTCTCSYQNQASVGLIHMPEADLWTFTTTREVKKTIRRLGVNLGAPGSRKDDKGTLWLEYPQVGGPSPKVNIKTLPEKLESFRLHAGEVKGEGQAWVSATGIRNAQKLSIGLVNDGKPTRYTVRLHFAEPDSVEEGKRVFDVVLQGKKMLTGFDIVREAKGIHRGIVREFRNVEVNKDLVLEFKGPAMISGVEAIIEN
jgi:outer membrane protein assembly factor BamB